MAQTISRRRLLFAGALAICFGEAEAKGRRGGRGSSRGGGRGGSGGSSGCGSRGGPGGPRDKNGKCPGWKK